MPCRTRAKRGYVYLLPKMQQQLEYFKSLCCQCNNLFGVSSRSSQEYKYKRQVKEYASMLSGEVAYTSDIEIRYKIQCSKSNLNNDDGNGIVALKGTVLTFTVNQFATCDISYVLRIKTSEFICKESVHILCALSMKQYWSNLVYNRAFTCKRDTYVSTQRYWKPILMNENSSTNLWYCIKIQLQHSNQIRDILIYEGENVSIQNRNLCIGYQYQRWKFSREW